MAFYSVRELARMAGVSVRTLHHYDRLGLLKPAVRTESRYRLYADQELLRLQQILFYKELDFSLDEIRRIVEAPDFNVLTALDKHRQLLEERRNRLTTLLDTIDRTILKVKGEQSMLSDDALYAGFPKEKVEAYRQEAGEKYGAAVVQESKNHLRRLGKIQVDQLKADQQEITQTLAALKHHDPASVIVQEQIARHYANIRAFWGNAVGNGDQIEAYKGLAQLYSNDLRYTAHDGEERPEFASFLTKAMLYFADRQEKN